MRSASESGSSYASGGSPRQRAVAAAVAIAANLLLILMLLRMAGITPMPKDLSRLTVFGVQADKPPSPKHERKAAKAAPRQNVVKAAEPAPARTKAAPVKEKTTPFDWAQLGILQLNHQDYASSDVGRIAPHPAEGRGQAQTAAGGAGGNDSDGAGAGPQGQKLYWAEWYRRPTDAELSTYVQGKTSPGAWAEVACRTVERYHVDDCVELADSPPGSRLAGAIRQAAFQFLVRPPRIDGKPLVGEWVRIRIDFTESRARAR